MEFSSYLMRMNWESALEKLPELGEKLNTAEDVMETELRRYRETGQTLFRNLCDTPKNRLSQVPIISQVRGQGSALMLSILVPIPEI